MGVPRISTGPMMVDEFYAFTDSRPDYEKWELIDGEPVLNASPSRLHQRILKNLMIALGNRERDSGGAWEVLPGLGVLVSDAKRPEPDLLIVPNSVDLARRDVDNVIVAFEILSPSTDVRDLKWKRAAYTSLASLTDYVVVAQDAVEIVVFARAAGFEERRLSAIGETLQLPSRGVSLPLSEIYRDTGLV
jgi:Uma2 family endonuclease